jgi:hypothetical protein
MTLNCSPEEALTVRTLENETVAETLTGKVIGYSDGGLICDGCGKRLNAYEHIHENDEKLEITGFAATPRGHYTQWKFSLVFCPECDEREVGTPTSGVDEAMVEMKLERGPDSPVSADVEVVDRSKPDDGVTG